MKKLLFILVFIPFLSNAQINFTQYIIDSSSATIGVKDLEIADFNNDGLNDLAALQFSGMLNIYTKNAFTAFDSATVVSNTFSGATAITVGDFDKNGWQDIAEISFSNDKIFVVLNQNGTFGTPQAIYSGLLDGVDIKTADMDNDNDDDLVVVGDTAIIYLQNDGSANFTPLVIDHSTEYYSLEVKDINNDQLPDIMTGSIGLNTYINKGNDQFSGDTLNLSLLNNFIFQIEAADIDQDGDNDIGIYYANNIPDIDWYENDGTGHFTTSHSITVNSNDVRKMVWADLNNDSFPDFITAYGQSGELVYMLNNGSGGFGSENVIHQYPVLLLQVAAGDVDNDGDVDIICGHNTAGLYLWQNQTFMAGLPENPSNLSFYPNPAHDYITINTTVKTRLQISDLGGKILYNTPLNPGKNRVAFDLKSGIYILSWNDGGKIIQHKLAIE